MIVGAFGILDPIADFKESVPISQFDLGSDIVGAGRIDPVYGQPHAPTPDLPMHETAKRGKTDEDFSTL